MTGDFKLLENHVKTNSPGLLGSQVTFISSLEDQEGLLISPSQGPKSCCPFMHFQSADSDTVRDEMSPQSTVGVLAGLCHLDTARIIT